MHTFRYCLHIFILSFLSCSHLLTAGEHLLNKTIETLESCEEKIGENVIKTTINPPAVDTPGSNFYTNAWDATKCIGSNLWLIASHPLIALMVGYFLKEYIFNLQKKERQDIDFVMETSTKMLNNEKDFIVIRNNYNDLVQNCADKCKHVTDLETKKKWQQHKQKYEKEYELINKVALTTKQNVLSLQNNFAKELLKKEIVELKKMLQETQDLTQKKDIQKLIIQKEEILITLYND